MVFPGVMIVIDALKEFVTMVKDAVVSFIEGMSVLVESFSITADFSENLGSLLPAAPYAFLSVACLLIIVLRVVGR